ncbi:type IV pilus twitching motility protein PilT [Vibrio owensii]|uniref:type IV pilus twitching motility protein PilT n=1 Tax=Vibrio harveyi group TaxID=717610 RepID=UPI003CC60BF0
MDKFEYCLDDLPARVEGIEYLNKMLEHMENHGGSDLFIMGGSEVWMSMYSRKVRVTRRKLTDKEVESILLALDGTAAIGKIGSGKPINTAHEFKTQESVGKTFRHRFRVNAVGCLRSGRKSATITLRSIPTTPKHHSTLGIEEDILNVCRLADQGLILVVGATGNGKSTLLSSVLRDQVEDPEGNRNLITIEEPIEFVYDDVEKPTSFVTQMEVGRDVPSFGEGVINSLRMAPTTILIGEARDYETVSSALEASVTGHVVFSTVHANSVAETFERLVAVFPEKLKDKARYELIQSIKLIVAQRLIPTVDGKRVAIREYLELTHEAKEILMASQNLTSAAFQAVEAHGRSMMADVEDKLAAGLISEKTYERQKANYEREKGAH